MNVTVSSARFYNFEFSNTACLTDGGTFGFVDGTGWVEGVEIPSERDGIQVLGQNTVCLEILYPTSEFGHFQKKMFSPKMF